MRHREQQLLRRRAERRARDCFADAFAVVEQVRGQRQEERLLRAVLARRGGSRARRAATPSRASGSRRASPCAASRRCRASRRRRRLLVEERERRVLLDRRLIERGARDLQQLGDVELLERLRALFCDHRYQRPRSSATSRAMRWSGAQRRLRIGRTVLAGVEHDTSRATAARPRAAPGCGDTSRRNFSTERDQELLRHAAAPANLPSAPSVTKHGGGAASTRVTCAPGSSRLPPHGHVAPRDRRLAALVLARALRVEREVREHAIDEVVVGAVAVEVLERVRDHPVIDLLENDLPFSLTTTLRREHRDRAARA